MKKFRHLGLLLFLFLFVIAICSACWPFKKKQYNRAGSTKRGKVGCYIPLPEKVKANSSYYF
jgi:hypothetical protein